MPRVIRTILFSACLVLISASSQCQSSSKYQCPNCNGILVSNCLDCDGYLNADQTHRICYSRKLFSRHDFLDHDNHYPFLLNDILGAIIWFLAAGVATACGVGGGGIYVPLGIILLRFASKPSSGLSQASIFGASLGGLILNIRNKHPDEKIRDTVGKRDRDSKIIPYGQGMTQAEMKIDEELYLTSTSGEGQERHFYTRPLIDYDMTLFLAPMEMAGAVMGVIIQKLLPNWLFLSLAGVILGFTSFKTFRKFFSEFEKEKNKRIEQQKVEEVATKNKRSNKGIDDKQDSIESVSGVVAENCVEIDRSDLDDPTSVGLEVDIKETNDFFYDRSMASETKSNESSQDDRHFSVPQDNLEKLAKRRLLLEEDSRQFPVEKIVGLMVLWTGLTLITFLKGGKGVDSLVGITCKSIWYPILIICQFLWLLGFAIVTGTKLVRRDAIKVENNYPFHKSDVIWDSGKLCFYATFTFIAGIVAGLIGIGGGMVLGPLMLLMGMHPRVSSATTATMIVLTSSSVAIMFVTSGLIPWEYALFFFWICFCGACVGKRYIDHYVKKTGMASVLIGILAMIIMFATIGCFITVLLNLKNANWCFDGFKKFCNAKGNKLATCNV